MDNQIQEEILNLFGKTGNNTRPRIRKFHADILYKKFKNSERVINKSELDRPKNYIDRMIKYSGGCLKYINEEETEIEITELFFNKCSKWEKKYSPVEELDHSDENLKEQGIILDNEEEIYFDSNLEYSRFHKLVSDEKEGLNDPRMWKFNDKNIEKFDNIDLSDKGSPVLSAKLFLLKFYILRKIDVVSFVTSDSVECPKCGKNYVISHSKIEFSATYKCESKIGDKICGNTIRKVIPRKMMPMYIYEISVEVKSENSVEFREYSLESFIELQPGFWTGMMFGRTETKSNAISFCCVTAKSEKSKEEFIILHNPKNIHKLFDITDSITNHIKKIGHVIDPTKANLPVIIETIKKLNLVVNKEINLDHSLYFGAPGIGKTYALTLLHHLFYSDFGLISGPRFSIAGLTGGQKEIYYQDKVSRRNVPGLFSRQAFIFDEINNGQFMDDDKAINLFKSVVLAPYGTSSTVGGKEFLRTSLIAATANYNKEYHAFYENIVKKNYEDRKNKKTVKNEEQKSVIISEMDNNILDDFDFYCPIKNLPTNTPQDLKNAILKARDRGKNYLTNFEKPLMERFYWSVLLDPKFDKINAKQNRMASRNYLNTKGSKYGQRELLTQLFVSEFDTKIKEMIEDTRLKFEKKDIEEKWTIQVDEFLSILSIKYPDFFSIFQRIDQVHTYTLYTLSLINGETELSFATKRVFEKLISLLHVPIEMSEFHMPDFINFPCVGENHGEMLELIKRYPNQDLREFVNFENHKTISILVNLENKRRIKKTDDYRYEIDDSPKFEKIDEEVGSNESIRKEQNN